MSAEPSRPFIARGEAAGFGGKVEHGSETTDAVVPSAAGHAWITSFDQLVLEPSDPCPDRLVVGTPWELYVGA